MHCAELVDVRAAVAVDARCIGDDAVALNNGQFAERVRSVAGLLAQSGVRRGDGERVELVDRVPVEFTLLESPPKNPVGKIDHRLTGPEHRSESHRGFHQR